MNIVIFYHNQKLYNYKQKIRRLGAEQFAKKINNNKKLQKVAVFTIGSLMYCRKVLAEGNRATKDIDAAGIEMLSIVRSMGYWLCIIMCVIEIIKSLMEGDPKGISKIMIKYALAFSSLYFFPWILDFIKEVFA